MNKLIIFLFAFINIAYGQSQQTTSKPRFVNGVYIGTKPDLYFNSSDSNAIYWTADSLLKAKYKGAARSLAFSNDSSSGYVPYIGANKNLLLGNFRLVSRSASFDSVRAQTSAGGVLVSNSGVPIASYGAGGSNEFTFNGFAGYKNNSSIFYTDNSFTDKKYVDSGNVANKLPVIAWGNSLTFGFGATSNDSTYPAQASRLSGYNFVNKGVSGETPAQINARVYAESADTLLMPSVFWAMENISDTAQMTSQLDSFVAKINHDRWIAVAPVLRSGNPVGNSAYNQQRKWTADAFKKYGNHIIDMQYWLINFVNGSTEDSVDAANGVIPRSLRVDNIHLNNKGYRIAAERIIQQLNLFTQGNNTYTNSIIVSAQQGSPILNGNGLFQWKNNNHSYINSYSATTPYLGGDTLTIQPSAGVVNIAPATNSSVRLGFLPIRTTSPASVIVRGSETDTSRLSSVLLGSISGVSGDISVSNGVNRVVGGSVVLSLPVVSTTPGTFGTATKVPQFTYDAKGRILGANEQDIIIPIAAVTDLSTQLAGKANLTGASFTGDIFTAAGEGIVVGGSNYLGGISPSATRGVLQVSGSTDQFLTMGANGYFLGSASLMRILGGTGREFDIVADNTMAFKIFNTTRNVVIQNGGSFVDSTAYKLQVSGSARATGGYYAVNGLFQAIGANTNLSLRANGNGEARINENNGTALKFYGGGASELFTANTNGTISNTANQNSAWAFSTTNNGTTNANGALIQLGASSTGLGLQVTKGGNSIFTVDNLGGVTASRGRFSSLVGNSLTPTILMAGNFTTGIGAIASVVGNDIAGEITFTTTTGISTSGTIFTFTFSSPYPSAPIISFTPASETLTTGANPIISRLFVSSTDTGQFQVSIAAGTLLTESTTFKLNYHILGR